MSRRNAQKPIEAGAATRRTIGLVAAAQEDFKLALAIAASVLINGHVRFSRGLLYNKFVKACFDSKDPALGREGQGGDLAEPEGVAMI